MLEKTKLTQDELAFLSMFESITGVTPSDVLIEEERVTFLVDKETYGKMMNAARGMMDSNRHPLGVLSDELGRALKKKVKVVKFVDDERKFLQNFFSLRRGDSVKIVNKPDGTKYAIIHAHPSRRGAIIGRDGYRAEQGRKLAKRYFDLQNVYIR